MSGCCGAGGGEQGDATGGQCRHGRTVWAESFSMPIHTRRMRATATGIEATRPGACRRHAGRHYRAGWNMMMPMPSRATATPARSQGVGRTWSTAYSHARATPT